MINDIRADLLQHKQRAYKYRNTNEITDVIFHHSATDGTPFTFAKYHVLTKGWPGIAYHYVIDKLGEVYLCNDIDRITYHCEGNNTKSIGICFIGNFEKEQLTSVQIWKGCRLLNSLYNVIGHFTLGYHSQYKSTLCPGKHVAAEIERFLRDDKFWTLKQ